MSEVILLLGIILGLGFIALEIFRRTKISQVILLIVFGILIGPVFNFIDAGPTSLIREITPFVSTIALIFLLFDAGLLLDMRSVFAELSKASLFTFVVFIAFALITALLGMAFLGLPPLFALLLGTINGGVSSAIVLAIIERVGLPENIKTMLSLEATFTDILVVISSLIILNSLLATSAEDPFGLMVKNIAVSLFLGIVAFTLWLAIFNRVETHSLSYILTVAVMLFLYAVAERTGGNGGFSIFIFGLILGNFSLLEKYFSFLGGLKGEIYKLLISEIKRFDEEITFFIRTFLFVLTGLLITFEGITLGYVAFAVLLTVIAALIRSPVFSYLYEDASQWENKFVSVMIPRGLAAIVIVNILPELIPAAQLPSFEPYLTPIVAITVLIVFFSNLFTSAGVFWLHNGSSAPKQEDAEPTPMNSES